MKSSNLRLSARLCARFSALALAALVPFAAHAHRQWLLPSATVLSGSDPWVTVDAAVSNDLFYFEHFPLKLDNLSVSAPDGSPAKVENANTGRYRSTFDVHLTQPGTYKMAVVNHGVLASYKENGQPRRYRGSADGLAKAVPANAQELKITQSDTRLETFVTAGKPTTQVFKTTGRGLELVPSTHPNDLFAGEPANFQLLLDGKPAANVEVEVVPGGNRYRDQLGAFKLNTDAEGRFAVKWPTPGMYWIEAEVRDDKASIPRAAERRAAYMATFEVLPQ